jgi:hypothetical protein
LFWLGVHVRWNITRAQSILAEYYYDFGAVSYPVFSGNSTATQASSRIPGLRSPLYCIRLQGAPDSCGSRSGRIS